MTPKQARAAMRRLHAGGYRANAEFVCQLNRHVTTREPDRVLARAALRRIREANGGRLPRTDDVRRLQGIALAFRCMIGRLEGYRGLQWLAVEGHGDTWADAVADATRRHASR